MTSQKTPLNQISVEEADSNSPKQKTFSNIHKLFILGILGSYFFCVITWISPEGHLKNTLLPIISPIIQATSIGQSWSVFSPDVRQANYHETALICFDNGLLKLYEFPRMGKMNLWDRFRSEKYRKLFFDCMPWPDFQQFLPDFAQFVANSNESTTNPPQMISLIHHNCRTPLPDSNNWINRSDLPEHTIQTCYYVYKAPTKDNK